MDLEGITKVESDPNKVPLLAAAYAIHRCLELDLSKSDLKVVQNVQRYYEKQTPIPYIKQGQFYLLIKILKNYEDDPDLHDVMHNLPEAFQDMSKEEYEYLELHWERVMGILELGSRFDEPRDI